MLVRRLVLFLGLLSLLLVVALAATAGLVQAGILRPIGHGNLGWAAALPILAYLILSLRALLRARGDR